MHNRFRFLTLASVAMFAAGAETGAGAPGGFAPAPAARNWGDVDPNKAAYRLKPKSKELLLSLVASTADAPVFIAASGAEFTELVKHELVFTDKSRAAADGKLPAVLSPAGKAKADSYSPKSEAANPRGPAPDPDSFVIETDIPVPEFTRGGPARAPYPFEKLEVGHSFFIPPTASTNNPAKSKQSTITQYNKRMVEAHAKAVEAQEVAADSLPKVFKIKEDTKTIDGQPVVGARVWRTQ